MTTLGNIKPGMAATVVTLGGQGAARRRLADMGITPGVEILVQKTAPFGDPMEIRLRGYTLTLRRADADKIRVENLRPVRRQRDRGDRL